MTEEQRYREQTQLKKDEIKVLSKIADALVDIRDQLGSTFTPNELREMCGLPTLSSSIFNKESPSERFVKNFTGKKAEPMPVDDYIADGLDTIAEIIMNNQKQED